MINTIEKNKIDEYNRFSSVFESIQTFIKNHQILSYIEFDYYIVHNVTLFSIEPDFEFANLEEMIHQIKKATPAIKRIFNKPIIILKDNDDVLPVENARIINQNTFLHLASHSQYVTNVTKKGIKPRKLLTRVYEDEYSIYENIIFCNFVDEILSLIKKNRRILNSLLYASNIMRFNLLEKVNHSNYFLALGKLHTGYIRDFNQYFNLSNELLHNLSSLNKLITSRLKKPVYKKNQKRNRNLPLKKTNIFLMQKDYRQVYKTYKLIKGNQINIEDKHQLIDLDLMTKNYLMYVKLLTIFAIGHFNFEMDPNHKMNLLSLDTTFTFKAWTLHIRNNNNNEILLSFNKDKPYNILITNNIFNNSYSNHYKDVTDIHEIVEVNQFEEGYLERDDIHISMQDIDSFRRIQQIIFKGMIYSDTTRDECAFCGGKLIKIPNKNYYQCTECMTQVKEIICSETNKSFYFTESAHFKKHSINKSDFQEDDYWHYEKQIESLMHFKNITKINQNGEILCPYCNKSHEKHTIKQ